MAHLLGSYNALLLRRPMLVQCTTAAILFAAGDIGAQQLVEKRGLENHDFARTARLTFYRGVLFGPLITKWFQILNRVQYPSPTKTLIHRLALDQVLFAPVSVPMFYGTMSVLEGKADEAERRIKTTFFPTLFRGWAVYVPAQIVNFTLVPPHLRVVFISFVSLFWNSYLSAANASASSFKLDSSLVMVPGKLCDSVAVD